jgi:beta-galactosidase
MGGGLHKGDVWVGTKALGRFWSVGPQYALYTPGPWLQTGNNAVTVFDLEGEGRERMMTTTEPIFGATTAERN